MTADVPLPAGKLLRDNIPQLICSTGTEPVIRIAGPTEYARYLRQKLAEEVREYLGVTAYGCVSRRSTCVKERHGSPDRPG
jgi:hypothetical protein